MTRKAVLRREVEYLKYFMNTSLNVKIRNVEKRLNFKARGKALKHTFHAHNNYYVKFQIIVKFEVKPAFFTHTVNDSQNK